MNDYIEKDLFFFEENLFFDTKIKNKIAKLSGLGSFEQLVKWCSKQCYLKPKKV